MENGNAWAYHFTCTFLLCRLETHFPPRSGSFTKGALVASGVIPSTRPVAEVAAMAGFASPYYFSRALTPTAFRQDPQLAPSNHPSIVPSNSESETVFRQEPLTCAVNPGCPPEKYHPAYGST